MRPSDYVHQLEGRGEKTAAPRTSRGDRHRVRSGGKSRRTVPSVTAESSVQTDDAAPGAGGAGPRNEQRAAPGAGGAGPRAKQRAAPAPDQTDAGIAHLTAQVPAVTEQGKDVEPLSPEELEKRVSDLIQIVSPSAERTAEQPWTIVILSVCTSVNPVNWFVSCANEKCSFVMYDF